MSIGLEKDFKQNVLYTSLLSFIILFIVFGSQLLFFDSPSLMGQKGPSDTTEFIVSFPTDVVFELLKLFLLSLFPIFSVNLILFSLATGKASYWIAHYLVLIVLSISALLESALRFPAIYESNFNSMLSDLVFQLAFYLNPDLVKTGISVTFGIYLCLLVYMSWIRHRHKVPVSICAATTLLFFFQSHLNRGEVYPNNKDDCHKKQNLLFIAIDSLRSDYANDFSVMPNLVRFASDPKTIKFNDHHIGIPRTFPSWVEILQGRYGAQTGVRHMFPALPNKRDADESLPRSLRKAGYSTGVISDFAGDIFPRFNHGFEFIDTADLSLPTLIRLGLINSFPLLLPLASAESFSKIFPALRENAGFAVPARLTNKAKRFIAGSLDNKHGFFTTIFFSTAHFPYAAPWPDFTMCPFVGDTFKSTWSPSSCRNSLRL